MTRPRRQQSNRGGKKIPSHLAEALLAQLNGYRIAAGAAGVAMLACSSSANAAPICGKLSVALSFTATYAFNPAHQKIAPFNIAQTYNEVSSHPESRGMRAFFEPNLPSAKEVISSRGFPSALAAGATIGASAKLDQPKWYGLLFSYRYRGGGSGNFKTGRPAYAGFQFSESGKTHYGWLRMEYARNFYPTLVLSSFGYESTPDTAIAAGSCAASAERNTPASESQPSVAAKQTKLLAPALGVLALGSRALPLWRGDKLSLLLPVREESLGNPQ